MFLSCRIENLKFLEIAFFKTTLAVFLKFQCANQSYNSLELFFKPLFWFNFKLPERLQGQQRGFAHILHIASNIIILQDHTQDSHIFFKQLITVSSYTPIQHSQNQFLILLKCYQVNYRVCKDFTNFPPIFFSYFGILHYIQFKVFVSADSCSVNLEFSRRFCTFHDLVGDAISAGSRTHLKDTSSMVKNATLLLGTI